MTRRDAAWAIRALLDARNGGTSITEYERDRIRLILAWLERTADEADAETATKAPR